MKAKDYLSTDQLHLYIYLTYSSILETYKWIYFAERLIRDDNFKAFGRIALHALT